MTDSEARVVELEKQNRMLKKAGAVAVLAVASLLLMAQTGAPKARPEGTHIGRYQIVVSPHLRADTFLLDTETGRTWTPREVTDLEGNPTVWRYDDKVDNDDEYFRWGQSHTLKKKPEPEPPPQ